MRKGSQLGAGAEGAGKTPTHLAQITEPVERIKRVIGRLVADEIDKRQSSLLGLRLERLELLRKRAETSVGDDLRVAVCERGGEESMAVP